MNNALLLLIKKNTDTLIQQTKEIKQNKIKNKKQREHIQPISGGGKPNTRKQNKNISQNNKKFLKNVIASGFGTLTK